MRYDILIVDEEPELRTRYAKALIADAAGADPVYKVVAVHSSAAAQVQAIHHQFHLAIIAVRPSNLGIELAYTLKQRDPQLRLLLICEQNLSPLQQQQTKQLGTTLTTAPVALSLLRSLVGGILHLEPHPTQLTRHMELPSAQHGPRHASTLTPQQVEQFRECLAEWRGQPGLYCILLADFSGQALATWSRYDEIDMQGIAALAAGDLSATLEIGMLIGGQRNCSLIVQEHDEQTILIGRIGTDLMLLMATAQDVPTGWSRLTMRRLSERLTAITEAAALPHSMTLRDKNPTMIRSLNP